MTAPPATKKPPGGLRFWIRWLLPLCVVIVTAVLIAMDDQQEMEIAVDATFTHLDAALVRVAPMRPIVRLRISAAPSLLSRIDFRQAACRIDLSGLGAGSHTIAIDPADIHLPKGVSLSAVLTRSLVVRLAVIVRKTVAVEAVLAGKTAPGYTVKAVRLKPEQIVLSGTAAALDGIETVKTHPIPLEDASETFKREVPLDLPETIAVEPPLRIVVVEIQIDEQIVTRVLTQVPVAGTGAAEAYQITPNTIDLTVRGPETIVQGIEKSPDFGVTIRLSGLSPGTHQLKATIRLPVQTVLVAASPEHFTVTISK